MSQLSSWYTASYYDKVEDVREGRNEIMQLHCARESDVLSINRAIFSHLARKPSSFFVMPYITDPDVYLI